MLKSRAAAVISVMQLLCLPSLVHADDEKYGDLDFTHMSKAQEKQFWVDLFRLAYEEEEADFCRQPFDFEHKAMAAIKTCVTADALRKADSFFKISKRYFSRMLVEEKWVCHGPFNSEPVHFADAADETDRVRKQMASSLSDISGWCQRCKTSVWALFCR